MNAGPGPHGEDDRDEHDVDGHLEERIEDPPEVAEQRVGALLADVGLHEVTDQAATLGDLGDGFAEEADGSRTGGATSKMGWRVCRRTHGARSVPRSKFGLRYAARRS
jgi:hypothetical protein